MQLIWVGVSGARSLIISGMIRESPSTPVVIWAFVSGSHNLHIVDFPLPTYKHLSILLATYGNLMYNQAIRKK
jgi:hypothetical protein